MGYSIGLSHHIGQNSFDSNPPVLHLKIFFMFQPLQKVFALSWICVDNTFSLNFTQPLGFLKIKQPKGFFFKELLMEVFTSSIC